MKTTRMLTILVLALGLMVCSAKVAKAEPIGTGFTYQGHLYDANHVAEGLYDFQFKLFDDDTDGNQVSSDVNKPDMDVVKGYFTVELDFGTGVFDGNDRWLETGVRLGELEDPNSYTTLIPRQEVTPTPYAVYAQKAGNVAAAAGGKVPKGGIIMWSGSIADIPNGWALCDGNNDTPDLTSRFIRSVPNASTDPGSTGGSSTHSHGAGSYTASAHTHTYSGTTSQGNEIEYCNSGSQQVPARITHTHSYSGTTSSGGGGSIAGTSAAASSLPPYYELAFIMRK